MFKLKVNKMALWPIRSVFIAAALFISDYLVEVISRGYVTSAGGTKFHSDNIFFIIDVVKYTLIISVLVFLCVQTTSDEDKK